MRRRSSSRFSAALQRRGRSRHGAQQAGEVRRIAVLLALAESDPEAQDRIKPFQQGMRELDWIEGRNIRIDYRFTAGSRDRLQTHISELVATAPEVILVDRTPNNDSAASSHPHKFRLCLLK